MFLVLITQILNENLFMTLTVIECDKEVINNWLRNLVMATLNVVPSGK